MFSRIKPGDIETAIHRVTVEEARRIRGQILTAGAVKGSIVNFGDDEADTLHVGALVGSQLAAIASVCCESMPASSESGEWRLRGMATVPEFRGNGLGTRLLECCIAHVAKRRGRLLWCTARVSAASFYRSFGFMERSGEFRLPEYGDKVYILMSLPLGEPKSHPRTFE